MAALNAISREARVVLLEALMGVAWADRVLVDEEREAAKGAALSLGLVLNDEQSLTSPDRKPVAPEHLAVDGLSERDRELIYLCAAWMALADEVEDPTETRVLERLQTRLGLSDERVASLRERATELQGSRSAGGSWWRAFDQLVVAAAKDLEERG